MLALSKLQHATRLNRDDKRELNKVVAEEEHQLLEAPARREVTGETYQASAASAASAYTAGLTAAHAALEKQGVTTSCSGAIDKCDDAHVEQYCKLQAAFIIENNVQLSIFDSQSWKDLAAYMRPALAPKGHNYDSLRSVSSSFCFPNFFSPRSCAAAHLLHHFCALAGVAVSWT